MAKKLSRKQRKLITMKEMERNNDKGKKYEEDKIEVKQPIKYTYVEHKQTGITKFTMTIIVIAILTIMFCAGLSIWGYIEDGKIYYPMIFITILFVIAYALIIPYYIIKAKSEFSGNILLDGEDVVDTRVTFGLVCGLVANILVILPIFSIIIGGWLYFTLELNKGFWSILIVILPFSFVIITYSILKLDKIRKKAWGIPSGLVIGTLFINLLLYPLAGPKNMMPFSFLPLLIVIAVIVIIFYILIKLIFGEISFVLKLPILYIWAAILIFNKSFDNSQIVSYDVTVTKKWEEGIHVEKYMIKFDDGEQSLGTNKIEVLESEYDSYEKGDHIRLLCRNGAFGLQYVESYYEVE